MERELAFLKRHGFVIAGVGLPLLLVAALAIARAVPRYVVEDPRCDLVYVAYGDRALPTDRLVCDVVVVDGELRVRWNLAEEPVYSQEQRVFRFDGASGQSMELPLPPAGELQDTGARVELVVAGLEDARLDMELTSPDGYTFESTYSGGGLFGEIFGSGSRRVRAVIERNGRRIEVPQPTLDPYGYGHPRFLGWAVPRAEGE
jgi:hypothetical protein